MIQTVHFFHPLTIILGRNGAGKTTVIEACLNATTGELPFGGAEKSSFVHDPRVLGESEVRAQIRFTFRAKNGNDMQVTRTFQSSIVRNTLTTPTIDASLAYRDPSTNKVVACTFRCSDIDKIIPELLGVSRAVLENVIFCHQEDGNWPLGTPSEVKKRFDDIFASTKYVGALEKFRENARAYRAQAKQSEATLLVLHEHCDQAQTLRSEIHEKEKQVAELKKSLEKLELESRKLKQVLGTVDTVSEKVNTLQQQKDRHSGALDERRKALQDLTSRTSMESFPGIEEVHLSLYKSENNVKDLSEEKKSIDSFLVTLDDNRTEKLSKLSLIEAASKSAAEDKVKRDEEEENLRKLLSSIDEKKWKAGERDIVSDMALRSVLDFLKCETAEMRSQYDGIISDLLKEMSLKQTELDKLSNTKHLSISEKSFHESILKECRNEISNMQRSYESDADFQSVTDQFVQGLQNELESTKRILALREDKSEGGRGR